MGSERERMKAEIMARVDTLVEQALTAGEARLTLTQIEDLALTARRQIEQRLTDSLLTQQVQQAAAAVVNCKGCGRRMHPKGQKRRYLRTRSGEVLFYRPYFYCSSCRQGVFPPGSAVGTRSR